MTTRRSFLAGAVALAPVTVLATELPSATPESVHIDDYSGVETGYTRHFMWGDKLVGFGASSEPIGLNTQHWYWLLTSYGHHMTFGAVSAEDVVQKLGRFWELPVEELNRRIRALA